MKILKLEHFSKIKYFLIILPTNFTTFDILTTNCRWNDGLPISFGIIFVSFLSFVEYCRQTSRVYIGKKAFGVIFTICVCRLNAIFGRFSILLSSICCHLLGVKHFVLFSLSVCVSLNTSIGRFSVLFSYSYSLGRTHF